MSASQEVIIEVAESTAARNTKVIVLGPSISQHQLAYNDLKEGLGKWRIWLMLSYQDIQLRYRRSVLGPLWITLSMAITVYSMGYLYAHLFHQDLASYFPFLVTGMLCWTLISTIITELTDGLVMSEGFIKQIKLPYTLYIHRIACRNILIFFHNFLVLIPIMLIYPQTAQVNLASLLLIPGLFIIYINTLSFGLIISMIGARYRDISQVIKSLLQIVFFVTPIMWRPEVLGNKGQLLADLNPIYAFLELVRQPLLGSIPTLRNIVAALVVTLVGLLFSAKFFSKYRSRIVYWL